MSPPSVVFTVNDYRALPETGPRYQLLEGDLVLTPAPNTRHQRISRNIETLLIAYAARTGRGEVFHAPFDVYLDEHNVLQPDVLLVLEEHRDRIAEDGLHGPADLVTEISSPSTATMDRETKRKLYARHGTQELWLVDDEPDTIQLFRLQENPDRPHAQCGLGQTLASPLLPGFEAPLDQVFPSR